LSRRERRSAEAKQRFAAAQARD